CNLNTPSEVKWLSPRVRNYIASHSPNRERETGLRIGCTEKRRANFLIGNPSVISPGPFRKYKSRVSGQFCEIWQSNRRFFSAVKTGWRRERDSNPRYGFATLSLDVP